MDAGATIGDRKSEAGEREILSYLRETQSAAHGRVVFNVRAIAQEVGWPVDDVELVLLRLLDKAWIKEHGGGYVVIDAPTSRTGS